MSTQKCQPEKVSKQYGCAKVGLKSIILLDIDNILSYIVRYLLILSNIVQYCSSSSSLLTYSIKYKLTGTNFCFRVICRLDKHMCIFFYWIDSQSTSSKFSIFSDTQLFNLGLNISIFVSERTDGGSWPYQWTAAQHQLLLVNAKLHAGIEGWLWTPEAARALTPSKLCHHQGRVSTCPSASRMVGGPLLSSAATRVESALAPVQVGRDRDHF